MPVLHLSNNDLIPSNQRNSDVAAFAVEGIAAIQQQKTNAAFHVQGIQCILYRRLNTGMRCSCQTQKLKINERLGKDGKASPAVINQLLMGSSDFGISDYKGADTANNGYGASHDSSVLNYTGDDPSSSDLQNIWNNQPNPETGELIGDQTVQNENADCQLDGFDYMSLNFGDSNCPICYGSGFIGGYSIYNGVRKVVPVDKMITNGILNVEKAPYSATLTEFQFSITLPRGFVGIDFIGIKNGWNTVTPMLSIDGIPLTYQTLKAKCDGKSHIIHGKFKTETEITHFELQLNLSSTSAYIEFPKIQKSSNMGVLNRVEDMQLLASPNIPMIKMQDIIFDTLYGFFYYVQSVSWQNTRQRQMMGWEMNVRVIQQQEAFYNLPQRKPFRRINHAVLPAIGNIGNRP